MISELSINQIYIHWSVCFPLQFTLEAALLDSYVNFHMFLGARAPYHMDSVRVRVCACVCGDVNIETLNDTEVGWYGVYIGKQEVNT